MWLKPLYNKINLFIRNGRRYLLVPVLLCCVLFTKAQNLVPNAGFEQFYFNENNFDKIPGIIPFWSSYVRTDWFHVNNINPATGNSCNTPYCTTTPKNFRGWQQPHNGLGYAGFYAYFRNSFSYREMLLVPLTDSLSINQKYCVSFYVSLADTARYALSLLSTLFVKDSMTLFNTAASDWQNWTSHLSPQVTNSSGFLSSKTNWMKVENFFTADSAYKYMFIGEFTNIVLHDTLHMPTGDNYPNPYAYYYVDDVSVTKLDEPADAGISDTLVTTDTSVVQLGNNSNINADYVWMPATGLNNNNLPNPTLQVTQSGWYHVQKTQCSYVTRDSVYIKALPTGLREYNANAYIKLYPNPANDLLNLELKINNEECLITIENMLGQIVYTSQINKPTSTINIKSLESGIYLIKVKTASGVAVQKLVVE